MDVNELNQLQEYIKQSSGQDLTVEQLQAMTPDELQELVAWSTQAAANTEATKPTLDIGEATGAGIAGAANALTLNNLEMVAPEYFQKLKAAQPMQYGVGEAIGTVGSMLTPMGVELGIAKGLSKIPQLAPAIQLLSKGLPKYAQQGAKGAAIGSLFGLATNPQSGDPTLSGQLEGRLKGAQTGAALGGALGATVPVLSEAVAKKWYKQPFKKSDSAAVLANKKDMPSDLLYDLGVTGGYETIKNKMHNYLQGTVMPEVKKFESLLTQIGAKFPTEEAKKAVVGALPNENRLTSRKDEIVGLKNYAGQVFDEYVPEGWFNTLRQYSKARKGFQKEVAAFERAGGDVKSGQLPLSPEFTAAFRSKKVPTPVELQGKDPSTAYAEPYEVWSQQGLPPLPTRPPEGFNPARGDDLLPLAHQMKLWENFSKVAQGPKYQGEILGLQNTPRTYGVGEKTIQESIPGQSSFPVTPFAPRIPEKAMTVEDFKSNLQEIGKAVKQGFSNPVPGKSIPTSNALLADMYGSMNQMLNKKVADQIGDAEASQYITAKDKASQILGMFPSMVAEVGKDVGRTQVNPLEVSYLLNPTYGKYALAKEGVELLGHPAIATRGALGLKWTGQKAPTASIPYFLKRDEEKKNEN